MALRQIDLDIGRLDDDTSDGLPERDEPMAEVVISSSDEDVVDGLAEALALDAPPREVPRGERQIAIDVAPLQIEPQRQARMPRQSAATAAFARAQRASQFAKAKATAAESRAGHCQQILGGMAALLLGASKLVGNVVAPVVGRMKAAALKPTHFLYLCRAAFLPARAGLQVGVKVKCLLAAAVQSLKHRQESGLSDMLDGSRDALRASCAVSEGRSAHLSYFHLWDEVNSKYVSNHLTQYRRGRGGVHVQTLVQRGGVSFTLASELARVSKSFREAWCLQPQKVMSTSAEALWPAIMAGLPSALNIMDAKRMEDLCSSVSSCTFQFLCDKASGNLLLMRTIGRHYLEEVLPRTAGKVLWWPETCTVHLHHRCKLQVRALRHHTMRHFSLANIVRLSGLRSQMLVWLEDQVPKLCSLRIVGPRRKDLPGDLSVFLDILYKLSAPHHDRKQRKKSLRHGDLVFLAEML